MTEDIYADSPLADLYTADKAVATLTKNLLHSSAIYVLAEAALLGWFYYASLQRKIAIQKFPCPPVLFTSSTGGSMYANGHMARPDGCR